MNKIKSFLLNKWTVATMVAASILGMGEAAFAQTTTYGPSNASSDVTSFAGTTFSDVAPMVIAVATALIGIILLVWGIRTVLHKVRGVRV